MSYLQSLVPAGQSAEAASPATTLYVYDEGGPRNRFGMSETTFELGSVQELFGAEPLFQEGIAESGAISGIVQACGYGEDRIRIDPTVVRGLEYYTGPVFEAELLFETPNEQGQPVRFGSVGGGGRYDGLVGRFRDQPVPATGFSIGVSRLFAALKAVNSPIVTGAPKPGPVLVLVMDRDRLADYQRMVAALRAQNIRAELYLGSAGMKAQMKYADRRDCPCAIIQGSQERENGVVQIKDLIAGKQEAAARETAAVSNAEYRAARLAQTEVPEGELTAAVRAILERYFT